MESNSILSESGRQQSVSEPKGARSIIKQIPKKTSPFFLVLAGGAVALSLGLAMSKKEKNWANFVGQWVPTILLLGIYDKIMKTQSLEQSESQNLLH
jgi:hypothetical protein